MAFDCVAKVTNFWKDYFCSSAKFLEATSQFQASEFLNWASLFRTYHKKVYYYIVYQKALVWPFTRINYSDIK